MRSTEKVLIMAPLGARLPESTATPRSAPNGSLPGRTISSFFTFTLFR